MARWSVIPLYSCFAFMVIAGGLGCRCPYNMYAPYGPQCVPPPATGTIGQPYYQPNPYGGFSSYPAYPAYPYATGVAPPLSSPSAYGPPTWPSYNSYVAHEGGWYSTPYNNATAPMAVSTASNASRDTPPRPSGEFLATQGAQQLRQNGQLPWLNSSTPSSANVIAAGATSSVPVGTYAEAIPSYSGPSYGSTYVAPVRPSFVRSTEAASFAMPIDEGTYYPYGTDYVLDPYANIGPSAAPLTYADPYGAQSINRTADANWAPRR